MQFPKLEKLTTWTITATLAALFSMYALWSNQISTLNDSIVEYELRWNEEFNLTCDGHLTSKKYNHCRRTLTEIEIKNATEQWITTITVIGVAASTILLILLFFAYAMEWRLEILVVMTCFSVFLSSMLSYLLSNLTNNLYAKLFGIAALFFVASSVVAHFIVKKEQNRNNKNKPTQAEVLKQEEKEEETEN